MAGEQGTGASTPAGAGGRLVSLDAYRGLIMLTLLAGSIFHSFKDQPGLHWLYVQNEHVEWEGLVYWDLIQPSFMFMVGAALPFALAKRREQGATWEQRLRHVLLRAVNLVLIGLLLDNIGAEYPEIGFMRVLQQIAFGYVLAFFVAERGWRAQALAAGGILIGYHLLWVLNPWNGPGGPWALGNENIGSALDRWAIGRNYRGYYVGLNAIPSTATILFGVLAGDLIRCRLPHRRTLELLIGAGGAAILVGLAVSPGAPIIKRIWTPSFALLSGGCTTLILAAFYWLIEVRGHSRWAFPLVVVGMNSIAAYVLSSAFGSWFRSATGAWIACLEPAAGPVWFPVLQRTLFVAAAWGVLYWLYRRKIFFKA